jgi:chromate transporter
MVRSIILAGAGLLLSAAAPLARDAIAGPLPLLIASGSLLLALLTRIDTVWMVLGAGLLGLIAFYV